MNLLVNTILMALVSIQSAADISDPAAMLHQSIQHEKSLRSGHLLIGITKTTSV
jgi:hypothetical protein